MNKMTVTWTWKLEDSDVLRPCILKCAFFFFFLPTPFWVLVFISLLGVWGSVNVGEQMRKKGNNWAVGFGGPQKVPQNKGSDQDKGIRQMQSCICLKSEGMLVCHTFQEPLEVDGRRLEWWEQKRILKTTFYMDKEDGLTGVSKGPWSHMIYPMGPWTWPHVLCRLHVGPSPMCCMECTGWTWCHTHSTRLVWGAQCMQHLHWTSSVYWLQDWSESAHARFNIYRAGLVGCCM